MGDAGATKRIKVFIDGSNLRRGTKDFLRRNPKHPKVRIDVGKLATVLCTKLKGIFAGGYYFSGYDPQKASIVDRHREQIVAAGLVPVFYETTYRAASCPGCKERLACLNAKCEHHNYEVPDFREKFVDVDLALHAWRDAPEYDLACIVSGDGDFKPLVKMLHSAAKEVRIISFSWRIHRAYWEFPGITFSMDSWLGEVAEATARPAQAKTAPAPSAAGSPAPAPAVVVQPQPEPPDRVLLRDACLSFNREWVEAAGLKSKMSQFAERRGIAFSEIALGFARFGDYLKALEQGGVIELARSDKGNLLVRVVLDRPTQATG